MLVLHAGDPGSIHRQAYKFCWFIIKKSACSLVTKMLVCRTRDPGSIHRQAYNFVACSFIGRIPQIQVHISDIFLLGL